MKHCVVIAAIFICCHIPQIKANPAAGPQTEADMAFNTAWSLFIAGELEKATEIVDEWLTKELPSRYSEAEFLYLRGYLQGKSREDTGKAIETLEKALEIYQDLAYADGVRLVRKGLGKHYLDEGRLTEAEALLELLLGEESTNEGEENTNKTNRGYSHILMSELYFKKGEYQNALTSARSSLADYANAGDKRGEAQARNHVGLFLMLTGKFDEGLTETIVSQEGIVDVADTDHYFHSLINTIIYHHCQTGSSVEQPIRMVKARLGSQYDKGLEEMLEFAMSYDCK